MKYFLQHLIHLADNFYKGQELANILRTLFLYLGVIFAIFAFVQLLNYVATAIQDQLKQIGILLALGLGKNGIFKIYWSLMSLIGIVIWICSYLLSLGYNEAINSFLRAEGRLAMFGMNLWVPLILILLVEIALSVGCLIPILRIRKKTPAEIIRNGMIR